MDDPLRLRQLAQRCRELAGVHGASRRIEFFDHLADRWDSRAAEIERSTAGDKPARDRAR